MERFPFRVVNDDCYPYVSGVSGSVEKCRVPRRANLQTMKCRLPKSPNSIHSSNGDHKERKELFRTPPAYRVAEKEEDIMNELRERGPVQGNELLNQQGHCWTPSTSFKCKYGFQPR